MRAKVSKIKAAIIDDAPQAVLLLKLMLEELVPDDITIAGEAHNATDGLHVIQQIQPDLIFLDIEMPGLSGIELAKKISEQQLPCSIVFTTAYNQYAIQAFRLSAIDYLLKPIREEQLLEAIHKVKERLDMQDTYKRLLTLSSNLNTSTDKILSIPSSNGYEFVAMKDIMYLEADGSYVRLFIKGQQPMIVSKNLKYFEQVLEQSTAFFRTHRAYLINLNFMNTFSKSDRGTIIMKDGKTIDLARNRKTDFLKMLERLKSK